MDGCLLSYFRTPESLVSRFLIILRNMFFSCLQMYQVFSQIGGQMTVTFKIHPEFCRRETDKGTDTDFDKVITDLVLSKNLGLLLLRLL